jgi:MATE family multidrug resistance protein
MGSSAQGPIDNAPTITMHATANTNLQKSIIADVTTPTPTCWHDELRLLVQLAAPTIVVQLGFTIPSFLTASYVGRRFGPMYLDGFSLANLIVNLFTLSLLTGLYSASDTLSPQAFGAGNHREVGLVAMRGFVGGLLLIVPISLFLIVFMEHMLVAFGQDPTVSQYAWQWYTVYVASLPFYSFYMVAWKFLSAQNVMTPLLWACGISCFIVLPIALKIGTRLFGFLGSAVGVLCFQISQATIVFLFLKKFQPHSKETWPGLHAWREALHWHPLKNYFLLGFGGIVATSEWIYWETLSLAIGTLGVAELAIHTVPTQMILVTFMIPLGIGIALAIRIGVTLPKNVHRAKRLTWTVTLVGMIAFAGMSYSLYVYRFLIFRIFTNDPVVLAGCDQIWWKVCFYLFHLSVFALNMGIATGLGLQWTLGAVTFFYLWVLGLPSAWYWGIYRAKSLDVTWSFIYPPYIFMNVTLLTIFLFKDWNLIQKEILKREGVITDFKEITHTKPKPVSGSELDGIPTESTKLLPV